MLYGSGIYIVSKDDMASFLEEVKQQYKDIDWFLQQAQSDSNLLAKS